MNGTAEISAFTSLAIAKTKKHKTLQQSVMGRLLDAQRSEAIGMLRAGTSKTAVARHFNCSRSTISRLQQRFRQTGSVKDRPRSGQPRVTTRVDDATMIRIHRRNPFRPATLTARVTRGRHGRVIHPCTVRRRLLSVGLKCRRPKKGVMLTPNHEAARLRWANRHVRYTRRQWGSVIFSDESKFNISHADGRVRVYREDRERFNPRNVMRHNRFGGGSVHVWGGITQFHKTDLIVLNGHVTANAYIQTVLQPVLLPFSQQHFPNGRFQFQHDNAPAHRARRTAHFLQGNQVNVLDWPALSPDMSPIEHIWDELGRRVYARVPPPQTVHQLQQALVAEWNNLPQQTIASKVLSMRRRCTACIQANGSYTRY